MKHTSCLRPGVAAFMQMMAMALTTSALSFFVEPVCLELDVGRGGFTVWYSLMVISGAAASPFLGRYVNHRPIPDLLLISSLWCGAGLFSLGFARQLWQFYLIGLAIGPFATGCMLVCANLIVQRHVPESRTAQTLGVVMAGSGVGGMLMSLILPRVIETCGWQSGYRLVGLCWFVLVFGSRLILGRSVAPSRSDTTVAGSAASGRRGSVLYLLVGAVLILSAGSGIQQQIPAILADQSFSAARISGLMTLMTGAIALGKVVQGVLCSKLGPAKAAVVTVLVFMGGFWMLHDARLAALALTALAFGMGILSTVMPMVARRIFPAESYAGAWGVLTGVNNAGAFLSAPLWGMVYDLSGSYRPGLMVAPILLVVALVLILVALNRKR